MLHQQITKQPTPAQAGQRSYRVTYDHLWERRGMPWCLQKYGAGHWCVANGEPNRFTSEEAARAAGDRWNATGREAA